MDSFKEVSTQSWGSRLVESIKGVLVGIVLFLVSFPVLFLNEGRAVRTYKSLAEGQGAVVSVAADKVEQANDQKLVHLSGEATTKETLSDPELKVSVSALRLERLVDMYQWKEETKTEKKKNLGGSEETVTTYTYTKDWSPKAVDSSSFKKPQDHVNPGPLPIGENVQMAKDVTLGAFTMTPALIERITSWEDLPPPAMTSQDVCESIKKKTGRPTVVEQNVFYSGANPSSPDVGDVRVRWKVVKPATVSVVAQQIGRSFQPYQTKAGDALLMLKPGTMSAQQMFAAAEAENAMLTWILRAVGFLLMAIGLGLVFAPISTFADVIPLVGDLLRMGTGLFALAAAFGLSFITIAVAWLFYRPLVGVPLLVLGIGAIVGLKVMGAKKAAAAA
jgi:hypothetical protein